MKNSALQVALHKEPAIPTAPDFNRLAPIYRWMEWLSFGPYLWRCRCAFLNHLNDRRRALVLGDGDGRFTARLLARNPGISIDAVDASTAMLDAMSTRAAGNNTRLQTHLADARSFQPSTRNYDLVVTHFFLDCLTTDEVHSLAARLRRHVTQNVVWVVSEFAVPSSWYGRAIARPLIAALYLAFGWMTGLRIRRLPLHREALNRAGWSLDHEQKWLGGLLVSESWRPALSPPRASPNVI